jgi:ribosomal-protein-alanine N-acetyltransferase
MSEVTPMVLRGYREGDLEAMYALDVACFERPFRFSRGATRRFAEAKKARVVVAELHGQMVGFGIVHVERVEQQKVGYVVTLDVAVESRRSGIGRVLMGAMEREAIEEGCSAMALHVYVANVAAIGFYERCGFVFSHVAEGFYGDGLDAQVWHKVF